MYRYSQELTPINLDKQEEILAANKNKNNLFSHLNFQNCLFLSI